MQIHTNQLDSSHFEALHGGSQVLEFQCSVGRPGSLVKIFGPEQSADSRAILEQFQLHRLLSHSGTVDALDLVSGNSGVVGFSMPRLSGYVLSDLSGRLPTDLLLCILRDVAFSLFCIHSCGFMHGDISPNNIWVMDKSNCGHARMLDLGFAMRFDRRIPGATRGTPGFVAPECIHEMYSRPATDAFSFGRVIEFLLPSLADMGVKGSLSRLASRCMKRDVDARLVDFADTYFSVMRIGRERIGPHFGHTRLSVPLRYVGVEGKSRLVRSLLGPISEGVLVCCHGQPGSGKSLIVRSTGLSFQAEGLSTVRLTGVANAEELLGALEQVSSSEPRSVGLPVFVETNSDCEINPKQLSELGKIASRRRGPVVLELHGEITHFKRRSGRFVCTRPLTMRELSHSTSHLLKATAMTEGHSQAVLVATGGNPQRMREAMTDYVLSGRRERGEPLDFERALNKQGKSSTTTTPSDHSAGGELTRMRQGKKRIYELLMEVRACSLGTGIPSVSTYRTLSKVYGEYGSARRRSGWARRAMVVYSDPITVPKSRDALIDYVELTSDTLAPEERIMRLRSLLSSTSSANEDVLGYIKSEIGAACITAKNPTGASEVLLEALAHSKRNPALQGQLATILNRLGITRMLTGDYGPAKGYLTKGLRIATAIADDVAISKALGNLALLYQYTCQPNDALELFRKLRRRLARARRYHECVSILVNETTCQLDLGKSVSAEKHARLAVLWCEMLSDELRLGHAYNNLGWIHMTRCQGGQASNFFRLSAAIRERIGDIRGLADTFLNVARLNLLARNYEVAESATCEARSRYASLSYEEGQWDCERVLAKAALMREDYDGALGHLDAIPTDSNEISERDLADIMLLRLERQLWLDDLDGARAMLARLEASRAVEKIKVLWARRLLMSGFLALIECKADEALSQCGQAAEVFQRCSRGDQLQDALSIMALVASRMGNSSAGVRYLSHVKSTASRLKEELQ